MSLLTFRPMYPISFDGLQCRHAHVHGYLRQSSPGSARATGSLYVRGGYPNNDTRQRDGSAAIQWHEVAQSGLR